MGCHLLNISIESGFKFPAEMAWLRGSDIKYITELKDKVQITVQTEERIQIWQHLGMHTYAWKLPCVELHNKQWQTP